MFDAESRFDRATALSIASLVGKGGGLFDLSVKESPAPSCGRRVGVMDRVFRSLSDPSLAGVRAERGRISSVAGRSDAIPDQSPDFGRVGCSGDPVSGVRAPSTC